MLTGPAPVRGLPVGTGWMVGEAARDTREGVFTARPDGVTFDPVLGRPEYWQHRIYEWPQFADAAVVAATDVDGAMERHAALVAGDRAARLVVTRVQQRWGGSDVVVIVPLEPFTADDWLRSFRAARARSAGTGEDVVGVDSGGFTPVPAPPSALPGVRRRSRPTSERPSGWRPDLTGRHDFRYWNGAGWTKDVADGGKRSIDPL